MCDETTCVGRIFGYTKTKAKPFLRYLMFAIVQSQKLSLNFNFREFRFTARPLPLIQLKSIVNGAMSLKQRLLQNESCMGRAGFTNYDLKATFCVFSLFAKLCCGYAKLFLGSVLDPHVSAEAPGKLQL